MGKYLENFLGVDTVYSNNERSARQLARVVSMCAREGWMLLLNCHTAHCKSAQQILHTDTWRQDQGSRTHSVQQLSLWVGDTAVWEFVFGQLQAG